MFAFPFITERLIEGPVPEPFFIRGEPEDMPPVEKSALLLPVCPTYSLLGPAGTHTEVLKPVGR